MARSHVHVRISVGTPDTANPEWCDRCQLSTRIRVPLTTIDDNGVTPVGSVTVCTECEIDKD